MSRRRDRDKRKKKRSEDDGGGGASWMTTFSDLMSLLLTFFILLYSMSNIDAQKFENMSQSLKGVLSGLGYNELTEGQRPDMEIPIEDETVSDDELESSTIMEEIEEVYEKVVVYIEEEGLDADVTVNFNKRGIYVDIKEAILFDPGRADIKDSGLVVLEKIEGILSEFDNEILVEGHTDDIPINTGRFPSNWELSTSRSVAVLRYLIEEGNIEPGRIAATGYGEYQPIAPNNSEENRAINRRVNIHIIFDEESDKEIEEDGE